MLGNAEARIYRLPIAETISLSLDSVGLHDVTLGEDYPIDYVRKLGIDNIYSVRECVLTINNVDLMFFLIGIQSHYPYPFKEGSYREIVYYLCSQIVDPLTVS